MINLRIDSRNYQKNPTANKGEGLIITIPSQRKCFVEKDAVILTMRYFKVLHGMVPKNS